MHGVGARGHGMFEILQSQRDQRRNDQVKDEGEDNVVQRRDHHRRSPGTVHVDAADHVSVDVGAPMRTQRQHIANHLHMSVNEYGYLRFNFVLLCSLCI